MIIESHVIPNIPIESNRHIAIKSALGPPSKAQGHGRQGLGVLGPLRARGRLLPGAQVAGRGLVEVLGFLLEVLDLQRDDYFR